MPNMARKTGSKRGRKRKRNDLPVLKRPAGRPSLYSEKHHTEIAYLSGMCQETTKQLAARFGIDESKVYEWFRKYPILRQKWDAGKSATLEAAYKSLHLRIKGFRYREEEIKEDADGNVVHVVRKKRVALPDVSAISLFFQRHDKKSDGGDKEKFDQLLEFMSSLNPDAFTKSLAELSKKDNSAIDEQNGEESAE